MYTVRAFIPENTDPNKKIIVYGASVYGEIAYYLLASGKLTPDYYCDQLAFQAEYMGVPLIKPDDLKGHRNDYIIIASADYYHEIWEILEDLGCTNICHMSYMLEKYDIDVSLLSTRAKGIYSNKQNYIDVAGQRQTKDTLNYTRVQFVVSERCSLKCRDCLHLMQYYKHPMNVDIDKMREPFERLLKVVDSISEIRILGGEPFMNPDMYKIIEWWHDYSSINCFYIYTNGTIIPNDVNLVYMKRPKVKVYISDYGVNRERIDKLVDVLEHNNIKYYVSPYDGWADAGGLNYRNRSIKELQEVFSHCHARNCISFMYGKVHRCPRSAHAMQLRAMPDIPEDYVDILHYIGDDDTLKADLIRLQQRTWIEACNYCNCADLHTMQISAGVQTSTPLEYTIID